jgi:hypothetical protein
VSTRLELHAHFPSSRPYIFLAVSYGHLEKSVLEKQTNKSINNNTFFFLRDAVG